MRYTIDTNILVHLLTASKIGERIVKLFDEEEPFLVASIVTKAEIISIAIQRKWGQRKLDKLNRLISELYIVPIDTNKIVQVYADIDAFSQGKHPSENIGISARNMGKNDLWIAATTKITGSVLLTTDNDFDHLDPSYFKIIKP